MVALPQEDLLMYQRAETANREVLDMLQHITRPSTPLHDQALTISRRLQTVLADILRSPMEAKPDPPARY